MSETTKLSLRVVALFTAAMFLSFIPEYLHSFFGDWMCEGSHWVAGTANFFGSYEGCDYDTSKHMSQWHWGWRHWLWCVMCMILFAIQAFDIIKNVVSKTK